MGGQEASQADHPAADSRGFEGSTELRLSARTSQKYNHNLCDSNCQRSVKILFHQREAATRKSQSFLPCVQLLKLLLELFKLLSSFAELAFRCQPLIVSEVSGGSGNERVQIRTRVGSGCAGTSSRFNGDNCGAQRRGLAAK